MLLNAKELYRFDGFELDPIRRVLSREDEPILLTPKAFDVLAYLVLNPGRVVTKDELLKAIWPDSFVEEGNLAQYISSLRKAMGDKSSLIATISGRGYQFGAQVFTAQVHSEQAQDELPDARQGSNFVQRVRKRTRAVFETSSPEHTPPALPAGASSHRNAAFRWGGVSLLAAVLIALAAILAWKHFASPPQTRKVMVADFANTTGDPAFDRTLKRALEIDLEQSPYIDVMSEREAMSTLKLMGLDSSTAITPGIAKEICERSNRQVLLTGNIVPMGQEYLLTLEATDCASGKELGGAKAEAANKEKVLAALDSVVDHVRRELGESSQSLESFQVPIVDATTPSFEALESFSIGQNLDAQGASEIEALPFYQRAVELDPQFAMAYSAIATEYYNLTEYNVAAQYYRKAFELSNRISAKEKLIIQAHYYCEGQKDVLQGIQVYWMWANTYPHDWAPWVNLTNEYTQLGQYAPAIAAGERAVEEAPGRGIAYSVLARAYRRANRFAEAKSLAQRAEQRGIDSLGLHSTLMQIAFAENDQVALTREIQWGETHNGGWYFLDSQAGGEAATGHIKKMEELLSNAYESAINQNLHETADEILLDQAQMEFEFGLPDASRATLSRLGSSDTTSPDLAILHAKLGDAAFAERYLEEQSSKGNSGTHMAYVNLPLLRAALATEQGRPLDAVAALEPAKPYEMANYNVLTQRAEAYLKAGRPEMAIPEYQKVLANPGIDPLSPLYPLAHLGLARANAMKNNQAASRSEYEKFFDLWKNADADVPILKQARIEYSRLK
jgi:DNA-binding winged helix-turn-helix (wHTH) protein/tetratricopeptide (TPR) repeat protein